MIARKPRPTPLCKVAVLPSKQMIIRRYRSIENQRDLHTFFTEGLFSKQLTKFKDKNEGVVKNFEREGGLAGALAVQAGTKRRKQGEEFEAPSDKEWLDGLKEYHKDARKQHYANCWRLGTDEEESIWKRYTRDDTMVQGCAVETTVGKFLASFPTCPIRPGYDDSSPFEIVESPEWNIALLNENCDVRVAACRYQQRWKDESYQPGGWPAAVSFYKGEDFEIENEFRLVVNPFSSNTLLDCDENGIPCVRTPNDTQPWKKFVAATKWMANKIVMAPNSGDDEQEKVVSWLVNYGMNVNTGSSTDIELVESSYNISQRSTHEYLAEIRGTANYQKSDQHLAEKADEFLTKRDWEDWPIVDIVLILTEDAGGVIEGYWHQGVESAFQLSEYGHDHQQVWVTRFRNEGQEQGSWRNENAEKFDSEHGRRALSVADAE